MCVCVCVCVRACVRVEGEATPIRLLLPVRWKLRSPRPMQMQLCNDNDCLDWMSGGWPREQQTPVVGWKLRQ